MAATYPYSLEDAVADFFKKSRIKREDCDKKALDLVGGRIEPVAVQGNCSYSIYAGPALEYVLQFRPSPLSLNLDHILLARKIHGSLVPLIRNRGQVGEKYEEGMTVYEMPRIHGITYLDFVRSVEDTISVAKIHACRRALIRDAAR